MNFFNLKKLYTLIFVFCFYKISISQHYLSEKQIDSVFTSLDNSSNFNDVGLGKIKALQKRAQAINYTKGEIKCLIRLADINIGSSKFKKALYYINQAKKLCLAEDFYDYYIIASMLKSKILFIDDNYKQAQISLDKAYHYLPKIKNKEERKASKIRILIYEWYIYKNSMQPANSYRDSLLRISKEIFSEALTLENKTAGNTNILIGAICSAQILIEQNNKIEAQYYLDTAEKHLKKDGSNDFIVTDYYETKGDFYYKNLSKISNHLDKSLENYQKAIKLAESIDYTANLASIYKKTSLVYKDKKDIVNENLFLNKSIEIENKLKRKKKIELNKIKNDIYTFDRIEDKIINRNNALYIFGFTVLLTIAVIIFYKSYNTQKINNNSQVNNNILLDVPNINLIEILKNSPENFYPSFIKAYPDFQDKLLKKNSKMKSSDIELCAMIMLQMDTKKIALLQNKSIKSVESKKYRIRKKLNIPAETHMSIWLNKL